MKRHSKETKMANAALKQSPITQTIFDIDLFEEVKLYKAVPDFIPAENSAEVLVRAGNDTAKVLELMNAGLKAAERAAVETNGEPWFVVPDSDGEPINEVFKGTPADSDKVNALVLTLAKTVFGFAKGMAKEEKAAAKTSAMEMIKTTPAIKAGLQKSAKVVNTPAVVKSETPASE